MRSQVLLLAPVLILALVTGLLITSEPVRASQDQELDCDAMYADHFTAWLLYLVRDPNAVSPGVPDPASPCFDYLIQAQADAVDAWAIILQRVPATINEHEE